MCSDMANFMTILLVLLLILAVVYSDADNSTAFNITTPKTPDISTTPARERLNQTTTPKNSTKCLSSLDELEAELSSKVPPLQTLRTGNWRNISKALFPALNLPSLYVKVRLQLLKINDGLNQTIDKVLKFTWAESCAYVTDVSLEAVTAFSLGTVLPQRRQTELTLTVHQVCEDIKAEVLEENGFKDENDMWRYALLTLQDIAIMPNVSDPRVNTAQCVVVGHEGRDKDQPIAFPADWYNWRGIWITIASIPLTIAISWLAYNWLERIAESIRSIPSDGMCDDKKRHLADLSSTFLFSTWFFSFSFPISEAIYLSVRNTFIRFDCRCVGIFLHFGLLILIFLIVSISTLCKKDKNIGCKEIAVLPCIIIRLCKESKVALLPCIIIRLCKESKVAVLPCIYQLVHHFLWVLCGGIPADALWTIPLILCECFAILTFICAIYYCFQDKSGKCHQLFISEIGILLGIFAVATSAYGCNVGTSLTDNLLVIIMLGALGWLFRKSKFINSLNQKKNKSTNGQESIALTQRSTSNGI